MAKDTATPATRLTPDGFVEQRPISASARGGKLPEFGDRSRMFYLAASPSWELAKTADGWRLLPICKRLIVHPGVWVRTPSGGEPADPSLMLAKHERAGMTILRNADDYMYEAEGAKGSKGYFLKWEKLRIYEDGAFEVVVDQAAEHAFRASLVTNGTVRPPRESALSELRNRNRKHIQRATRTPHLAQAQEAKAVAEERVTGLEEAIKALTAKPKPAKPAKADDGAAA